MTASDGGVGGALLISARLLYDIVYVKFIKFSRVWRSLPVFFKAIIQLHGVSCGEASPLIEDILQFKNFIILYF